MMSESLWFPIRWFSPLVRESEAQGILLELKTFGGEVQVSQQSKAEQN